MKVRFTQSGGFAGLVKGCEVDTTTLSPQNAKELEQLVKAAAISGSGEFLSRSGRDLQQYEITIEDGNRKASVIFDDQSVPQSVKPLVGYLKKCSKPIAP